MIDPCRRCVSGSGEALVQALTEFSCLRWQDENSVSSVAKASEFSYSSALQDVDGATDVQVARSPSGACVQS